MKKSFLPYAMAFMLIPQILVSQDSMDVQNSLPMEVEEKAISVTEKSPQANPPIAFLQTFELKDSSKESLKVVAKFVHKVPFELKIFNKNGLNIYEESFETDDLSLGMGFSNLPEGEYFISLKTKDGEIIHPIKN